MRLMFAIAVILGGGAFPAALAQRQPVTAIVGGTVFRDAVSPPIDRGVVLITGGEITAVGAAGDVRVPTGARVIDAAGMSVLPGYWNSHVHLAEEKWEHAATAPAGALAAGLSDLALRWGFTHVVDIGSFLENTVALRNRITSGEVRGPEIRTTGLPLAPLNGNPFYIEPIKLPQVATPEAARTTVHQQLGAGADYVKVFAGSPVAPGKTILMPVDVLTAVCETAHAAGRLVFAHPTSSDGLRRAVESGVDVIAHTTPDDQQRWSAELVREMRARGVSLIPTLKLWTWELERKHVPPTGVAPFVSLAQSQLKAFADAGGSILFGTDVGYMTDYDPTSEYTLMSGAGLSFSQILTSLTTEPARRFGASTTGRLSAGLRADVVLVAGRPDRAIEKLAAVVTVLRGGEIVYQR